jgi:phage host-nuclease inhibitor protein Gam
MSTLLQDLTPEMPTSRETFRITDLGSAIWCTRKLRQIRAQEAAIRTEAAAEIARIQAWVDRATKPLTDDAAYFEGLLTAWHAQEWERDPHLKSIPLPGVTLKSRALPDKVEVVDEATAIAAAKAAGYLSMIRMKEEIAKTEVVKHLKETGEVLPGVTVTSQPRRFTVELGEEDE